jgi:hypothetical protein
MIDERLFRADAMLRARLTAVQLWALIIGIAVLLACFIGAAAGAAGFFLAYLVGFLFWTGTGFGCFAVLMIHHLTGGRWGIPVRRILEAGTRTFPVMALLFIPLLFGLGRLYPWAAPGAAEDPKIAHKAIYLNVPFWIGRTAVYFAVWSLFAWLLSAWSLRQDRTGEEHLTSKLQRLSAGGLVALGLTLHFASVDWIMSLEPDWYSTIFGMILMAGVTLNALAFATIVYLLIARFRPFSLVSAPVGSKDLGNLILTFVILWTYVSFCQFLIIWAGNLKEEIPWYIRRIGGGWWWIALVLIVLHFFIPLFLLLSREVKRRRLTLGSVALLLVVLRFVDFFWMTHPASQSEVTFRWMDFAAPLGIGGVWVAVFIGAFKGKPLVPLHDPRFGEMVSAEVGAAHE